ncbi:MAG: BON domain-containing protein [Methylophilaceae bacterium]|nr:BON domain-containing protein [Methyloradius sp.]
MKKSEMLLVSAVAFIGYMQVPAVYAADNNSAAIVIADASDTASEATQKTKRVASDSWITTKVKSELLADSVTKGFDISVETSHGVVTLSGSLKSQDAIDHAKALAAKIKGVKSVDVTSLKVAAE